MVYGSVGIFDGPVIVTESHEHSVFAAGVELHRKGIFEKYDVTVLGTQISAVENTEDRDIFAQKLKEINEKLAPSIAVESVSGYYFYSLKRINCHYYQHLFSLCSHCVLYYLR